MEIKIYRSEDYWKAIQDIIFSDPEGWRFIWEKWLWDIADSMSFYNFRVVAIQGWEILGWIMCWSYDATEMKAKVNELYVVEKFRGKWVWRRLLQAMKEYYTRIWCKKIDIFAYTSNKSAIWLYISFWFEIKGHIDDYDNFDSCEILHLHL